METKELAAGGVKPDETLVESEQTTKETDKEPAKPEDGTGADADKEASEAAKVLAEAKKRKAEQSRERWNAMRRESFENLARAEKAERELAELRKNLPEAPTVANYQNVGEYAADLVKHTVLSQEAARAEEAATSARAEAEQSEARQWAEKVEIAAETYPDFEEKVINNSNLAISETMARVIRAIPDGADVAYQLAQNPAEARRISRLDPLEQVFALATVRVNMNAVAPKKITKAPEPIKAVGGRGANSETDPDKMTTDQWMKWDAARMKAKRQGG